MKSEENSTGVITGLMNKLDLQIDEFISRKYTFLEVLLLWAALSLLNGVLGGFTSQLGMWLIERMGFNPTLLFP